MKVQAYDMMNEVTVEMEVKHKELLQKHYDLALAEAAKHKREMNIALNRACEIKSELKNEHG